MSERLPGPEDWMAAARAGEEQSVRRPDAAGRTPWRAVLPAPLLQSIVDAARRDAPNETVGLLVGSQRAIDGGRPERYLRLTNAAGSPYRYLIDPQEQLNAMLELDRTDELVWGIVHSHVASAAVPSATDVGLAFYPDSLYLICSLAGEVPEVRAWSISEAAVAEVPLAVV